MKRLLTTMLMCVLALVALAQAPGLCRVTADGLVLEHDGREMVRFGFNYCAPFAHGYRMHKRLGADPKQAIDTDVLHMSRMGATAFRVHVWDVEITDSVGNLLANEHLDLLDYTIAAFARRGMATTLTALAFWGNGWPEPDDTSLPGFSAGTWKCHATVRESCIAAQERYIAALLNHRNPYTGHCYKDDPNIAAIELNNEPDHCEPVDDAFVTRYINRLARAARSTGCRKPLLYNIAQNPARFDAVLAARVDGITCQWYPIGLVGGHARAENFLPAVSEYGLPFADRKAMRGKARFVYEFDAADMDGSYVYPAMAASFRRAGFQWATQFAYDPLAIAPFNTDYQTHYLNLLYTPAKAVSYRIAAYQFAATPRFGQGSPAVQVSYADDLSLLNADTIFCHSASTGAVPADAARLRHVMGCGSSVVAAYDGSGVYFIDRLADGLWRLEVYPDAVRLSNAYARHNSQRCVVTDLQENTRRMTLRLPDLGANFECTAVAHAEGSARVSDGSFDVRPGVWILRRRGCTAAVPDSLGRIGTREYAAAPTLSRRTALAHTPAADVDTQTDWTVQADILAPEGVDSVRIFGSLKHARHFDAAMTRTSGCTYAATLPAGELGEGVAQYCITVYTGGRPVSFPEGVQGEPRDWDFYSTERYVTCILAVSEPIRVFDAVRNADAAETIWRSGIEHRFAPRFVQMRVAEPEHYAANATPGGLLFSVASCKRHRRLAEATTIVLHTDSATTGGRLRLLLDDADGRQFAATAELKPGSRLTAVPLSAFEPAATVALRDSYPDFAYVPRPADPSATLHAERLTALRLLLTDGSAGIESISLK